MVEISREFDDYTSDAATFGDRISAARDALGLTVSQLARRLGVKESTLQNWEDDRSEPRANKIQILSGLLNVSIIWLMTGEGVGPDFKRRADAQNDEAAAILEEVRSLRADQAEVAARLLRLERRLGAVLRA